MAIIVPIISAWNPTGLNKAIADINRASTQLQKVGVATAFLGESFTKAGQSLTRNVTVPILAAGYGISKTIQSASDLNETITKTREIFGGAAGDLEQWAKRASTALGMSQKAALDSASTFGLFAGVAGLSGSAASDFAKDYTKLAADFASFYNTSPEDAIVAIGAALRGESEPIRRYNILLDEATIKNRALKMGLISSISQALTPQQKVLARSAEIMAQSTVAQDDFARTSEGLANQQRILKAELTNVSAELGTAFLPIALKIVAVIRDQFVPALKNIADNLKNMNPQVLETTVKIAALAAGFGPLLLITGKVFTSISAIIKIFVAIQSAAAASAAGTAVASAGLMSVLGPIALVVLAIAGAIAIFVALWRESEVFRNAVTTAFQAVKEAITTAVNSIKGKLDENAITLDNLKKVFKAVGDFIGTYIIPIFQVYLVVAIKVLSTAIGILIVVISHIIQAISTWIGFIATVLTFLNELANKVKDVGTSFIEVGRAIVEGLKTGIANSWQNFKSWFYSMMGQPVQWAKQILRIASPSKVFEGIGENVIKGYIKGVEDMTGTLKSTMAGMAINSTVAFNGGVGVTPVSSDAMGGGGANYNITVNAGMGTDGAQVGREIVDAIRRFERASGSVFASA